MPTNSTLPLHPHLTPHAPHPSSSSTSPTTRPSAPPSTTHPRPQRKAATKARQRLIDAYALYPLEQEPDSSDSEDTCPRPRAPRPTPVNSGDDLSESDSDSDACVDDSDSESECPRPSKGSLERERERKRKRRVSEVIGGGKGRRLKAVEMDDSVGRDEAKGFVVKSGDVMKDMLLGKASRASWGSFAGPAEGLYGGKPGQEVRRAGLSDMGPAIGSNMANWRDEVWSKGLEGSTFGRRKGGARGGPVDGAGYRVSRFCEHF